MSDYQNTQKASKIFFTSSKAKKLEGEQTLPEKFRRLIQKMNLNSRVKGKKVCIKMHLGGKIGYTTIHPVFVRTLVEEVKKAGAKSVFVADGSSKGSYLRGYTRRSLGCSVKSLFNRPGAVKKFEVGYKKLDFAQISSKVLNSDFLIVLSHVKGHGDCGFGGAGKNIAMGCVPTSTRRKLHSLEGGIEWEESKCIKCNKCIEECPNKANKFNDDGKYEIFYHNCTYCRHCVMICPEGALTSTDVTFQDFQHGMALVNEIVNKHFGDNILFFNVLTNITIFCDCWGFSTPSLVPDIGIMGSTDIVAIDRCSLDLIKTENLIMGPDKKPLGLPVGKELGEGKHLFEKIHGKDPYLMSDIMADLGLGSKNYEIEEVE